MAPCAKCNKPNATKCCGRCKGVWYCSVDCQLADWKTNHKQQCIAPGADQKTVSKSESSNRAVPLLGKNQCVVCRGSASQCCKVCQQRWYCSAPCFMTDEPFHHLVCGVGASSASANKVSAASVVKKTSNGLGNGLFALRDFKQWEVIGVDAMAVGVVGSQDIKLPVVTEYLFRARKDPLAWLHERHFTLSRATLPSEVEAPITQIAKLVIKPPELVREVMSTLYEYLLVHPYSYLGEHKHGLALYPSVSLMNHSCDPNVASIYSGRGECYLVALRAIKAGDELCHTYRALLGLDSERTIAVRSLFDLFNGHPCACASKACVHRGRSKEELNTLMTLKNDVKLGWSELLESGDLKATAPKLVAAIKAHAAEPPKEVAESETRVIQLLLIWSQLLGVYSAAEFAKESKTSISDLCQLLSTAAATSTIKYPDTQLRIAALRYKLQLAQNQEVSSGWRNARALPKLPASNKTVESDDIPCMLLRAILATQPK